MKIAIHPKSKIQEKIKQLESEDLEISIQLENVSDGYLLVNLNGKPARIMPSSTKFNPRILVSNNSDRNQLIEIITKSGDTCIINEVFDKSKKQDWPIRFLPDCKRK